MSQPAQQAALERLMPLARGLVQVGLRDVATALVEHHQPTSNHAVKRIELQLRRYRDGEPVDLQRAAGTLLRLALNHQQAGE
jgi:hypothetical protein